MHTFENVDRHIKRQFDNISSSNICIFIWKNINNLIKANFVIYFARLMYYINKKKTFQHTENKYVHEIAYYKLSFVYKLMNL